MFNNKIIQLLSDSILWSTKDDINSNLYKTLEALNVEQCDRIKPFVDELFDEYNPFTTVELIDQWEQTVGIPDDCFSTTGLTVDQRRNQVLIKLLSRGASSNDDYAVILDLFGVTNFNIVNGLTSAVFPMTFPILISPDRLAAVNTITFQLPADIKPGSTYPLTFPVPFGDESALVIECYLRTIIPAHYKIIFEYIL